VAHVRVRDRVKFPEKERGPCDETWIAGGNKAPHAKSPKAIHELR